MSLREKGSDRFHLLVNSSQDSIVFAAKTLFLSLSFSFRHHSDTVWIKTWRIVEFSSRPMHPGKDSPHTILSGLRASDLRIFLHFGRIPLHQGTSAIPLPDLQWNRKYSNAYVFDERNVYILKKVVRDNEKYIVGENKIFKHIYDNTLTLKYTGITTLMIKYSANKCITIRTKFIKIYDYTFSG